MVKAARAGFTPDEPEALRDLYVQRLPTRRRGTSAIQAAPELGAHPRAGSPQAGGRHTHLRR
eukprot:12684936-Alexandrium_andersonii.AAC.1